MTQQLATTTNSNGVAPYNGDADPYAAFADEGGPGIRGQLLACRKGEWGLGPEADPVEEGTLFLMDVPSMMRGWLKWQGGTVADARVGLVADGFLMPYRHTLGDSDEAEWEPGPDGSPRDPWSKTFRVLLCEVAPPHGDVTFSGSSYGAEVALKELCRTYSSEAPEGTLPIVKLATKTRASKRYGKIVGPWFEVQGWSTPADVRAGRKATAIASEEEPPVPATTAAPGAAEGAVIDDAPPVGE